MSRRRSARTASVGELLPSLNVVHIYDRQLVSLPNIAQALRLELSAYYAKLLRAVLPSVYPMQTISRSHVIPVQYRAGHIFKRGDSTLTEYSSR